MKRAVSRVAGERWFTPYLFMLPGLALFGVFYAWPATIAGQLAFYRYDVVRPPVFIGLRNFQVLAEDPLFHQVLANTAFYLVGLIPFTVAIPLVLAVLVNQKLRGIRAFRAIYYLPAITSMVAVGIAWRYVFHEQGILNWLLIQVGLIDQPVQYLLDSRWALPAVILVEGWRNLGLYMMIYLAGLQAIPAEIMEAARVDGANAWQRLRRVTFPMMLPYTAVTLTVGMLDSMRVFESVFIMTRGGPQDATMSLGYLMWSTAFEKLRLGYANAIGIVMLVMMVILAVVNYRITTPRTK